MPRRSARRRSRLIGLLVSLVAVGAWSLVSIPAASAHAVVISSTPGDGERLAKAPTEVSIKFSEGVSSDLGGLRVLDAKGNRVDNGDSSQPAPDTIRTSLKGTIADGTYVANYKIVSADGHAVAGARVFGVGNGPLGDISTLADTTDPTLSLLSKVGQFLTWLGALGAAGLAFFIVFIHDQAADRKGLVRLTRAATLVAAFGALFTIVVQGALATDKGLAAVLDLTTMGSVLRQGLGWQSAVLLVGLGVVQASLDAHKPTTAQALAFYGGLTVTTSFVLWGHATEAPSRWLAIPADVVHVSAAALWFGGLVGLVTVLWGRTRSASFGRSDTYAAPAELAGSSTSATPVETVAGSSAVPLGPPAVATSVLDRRATVDDAGGAVPGSLAATVGIVQRFSTAAAISVVLLIAAGVALGFSEVGSFAALTGTDYGRILLIKVGVVAIIGFVAAYNRYLLLPWLFGPHDDDRGDEVADPAAEERARWQSLLDTVRIEAIGIVLVLAVTAVLTNTAPGSTTVVPSGPFQQSQAFGSGTVSLTITPNAPGANSLHLDFLGPDGRPADLAQKVTVESTLPSKDLGPITREMVKAGTGHFLLENVSDLSIGGDWTVTLIVRVSDFDQKRVPFQDTVA